MLSEDVHARRIKRLTESCPYLAALIKMADAPGATGYLRALPTEPGLRIASDVFLRVVRYQLGLSAIRHPMRCLCRQREKKKEKGKDGTSADQEAQPKTPMPHVQLLPNDRESDVHLSICKHLGGGIHTHDTVLSLFLVILKCLPGSIKRHELKDLLKHLRADLVVWYLDHPVAFIYDLTVANPLALSHLQEAGKETMATGRKRETEKDKKWFAESKERGYAFVPLPLEYTGGMSPTSLFTFERWARKSDAHEPYERVNWAAPTRLCYWQQRISVCLVRGLDRGRQALLKQLIKQRPSDTPPSPPSRRPALALIPPSAHRS
jgi:hypothetical protein